MKFYLSSAQDTEPYDDLNTSKLMKGYCQTIERETDAKVTFEKSLIKDITSDGDRHIIVQHIVVDIPSIQALVQIMKAIDNDLVIERPFDKSEKYPTLCIYDDYIEQKVT